MLDIWVGVMLPFDNVERKGGNILWFQESIKPLRTEKNARIEVLTVNIGAPDLQRGLYLLSNTWGVIIRLAIMAQYALLSTIPPVTGTHVTAMTIGSSQHKRNEITQRSLYRLCLIVGNHQELFQYSGRIHHRISRTVVKLFSVTSSALNSILVTSEGTYGGGILI
ncbi:hypothetical protein TNCV_4620731 [Trichonephila clavipes]|nr:hypothetical protein TNCV_4620731 [Trichonephila clavipes]